MGFVEAHEGEQSLRIKFYLTDDSQAGNSRGLMRWAPYPAYGSRCAVQLSELQQRGTVMGHWHLWARLLMHAPGTSLAAVPAASAAELLSCFCPPPHPPPPG